MLPCGHGLVKINPILVLYLFKDEGSRLIIAEKNKAIEKNGNRENQKDNFSPFK